MTLNVRDAPVRDSLMTLTTLDPPVQGLVSLWTEQHYGEQMRGGTGRAGSRTPITSRPTW